MLPISRGKIFDADHAFGHDIDGFDEESKVADLGDDAGEGRGWVLTGADVEILQHLESA